MAALAGALLLCGGRAEAAGFDCKKAASPIERLICEEPHLNSLDSQLEGAYRGALDRSNHPAQVTEKQQAWLKQRDACPDARCMEAAYLRQIESLSGISDEPPSCGRSFTNDEINACAEFRSSRADSELDRYVAVARNRLGGTETPGAKAALQRFDASQAAWAAYRETECGAVYDLWRDGAIRFAKHHECLRAVTKARTMTIWSIWLQYVDGTPPLLRKPTM